MLTLIERMDNTERKLFLANCHFQYNEPSCTINLIFLSLFARSIRLLCLYPIRKRQADKKRNLASDDYTLSTLNYYAKC